MGADGFLELAGWVVAGGKLSHYGYRDFSGDGVGCSDDLRLGIVSKD